MTNFTLQQSFDIPGIGSASGIVYYQETLYLISDNSNFLYAFNMNTQHCERIPLSENASDNIPKPLKPDFESLTLHDGKLYAFGSGSTENRNSRITYDLLAKIVTHKDLSETYEKLRLTADIPISEFNIEGAAFHDGKFLLFQRGNGIASQNGIFVLNHETDLSPKFVPIKLPQIKGVQSSFTDAIIINNNIYFLAAAEDSQSTYLDGDVLGSLFGRIKFDDFSVEETFVISHEHKFEGLCLWKENNQEITFILCEDNDSDALQSQLYTLTVPGTADCDCD